MKSSQFSKSYQTTPNFAKKALNHSEEIIRTLFKRIDDKKLKSNFDNSYISGVMNFVKFGEFSKSYQTSLNFAE